MGRRALVIVAGALLLGAIAALFVEIESPVLGRELLNRANHASGMELEARRFHFNLALGLVIDEVEAASRLPGVRYDLELPRLRFEHAPLGLLGGVVAVERIVAQSPRVTLRIGSNPPGSPQPPAATRSTPNVGVRSAEPDEETGSETPGGARGLRVELAVSELVIRDGAFVFQRTSGDVERLSVDGFDLTLREPSYDRNALTVLHGVTATGLLGVRELSFASARVHAVRAELAIRRGRLDLDALRFESEGRQWSGSLGLDANTIPFRYELSIDGGPFDIRPWASQAVFRFEGRGFGVDSRNLEGRGTASLLGGELPDAVWLRALERASGAGGLVGAAYPATEITFIVEDDALRAGPFRLTTSAGDIDVEGNFGLEGGIALRLALRGDVYRVVGDAREPRVTRIR